MTEKRFKCVSDYDWWGVVDTIGEIKGEYDNDCFTTDTVVDLLNELAEENEQLKLRFKEERELAMRLSKECDTLTIKKQELELEIIRLETIIKTGDNNDYNRAS